MVIMAQLVLKVLLVLKEKPDQQVLRVILVQLDRKVLKVFRVFQVTLVLLAHRVTLGQRDLRGQLVLRVLRDLLVRLGQLVKLVLLVHQFYGPF
jgi:hypothetical protein